MTRTVLLAVLLATTSLTVNAEQVVRGTVVDADTGQPLPAATIQVEGTYTGTVANSDGAFAIDVSRFPAALVVRFIGYSTERVDLPLMPGASIVVRLTLQPVELSGVVVTSEDPAVGIMRRVIAKKQVMRKSLERFRAEAYNRFTLENDTGIVSIAEGLSEFYWDHEKGSREIVTASRQTENMELDEILPVGLTITNLYDDNIDVAGHNLVGVTHPDAIDHYDFRLESTTQQEGRDVYTISVRTRSKLATGWQGTVIVADVEDVLLSVDLMPNDTFLFPPPIQFFDVTYRQQYLPYGEGQWLPADFRSELDLKVGFRGLLSFPVIRVRQFSRLSDYDVNVPLPDSLFESDEIFRVDSVQVRADSLLDRPGAAVPLSDREEVAYATIDSTDTLDEAFAPGGVLGRAARASDDDGGGPASRALGFLDITPSIWYNRVEGVSPALSVGVGDDISARFRIGRSFGLDQTNLGGRVEAEVDRSIWHLEWDRRISTTYDSWTYTRLENSIAFALGTADYFDYYETEAISAGVELQRRGRRPSVAVEVRREDATSVGTTTTGRLHGNRRVAANPAIDEGRTGSFLFRVGLGTVPDPFVIVGSSSIRTEVEVAQDGFLGSDHNFVRGHIRGTAHLNTFFRRRLLPMALDVHAGLGWSTGELPPQRLWAVDGSVGASRPGSLRTLENRPYVGDRTMLLAWEHHFRTTPFERLGWRWAVKQNWGLIAFGGHARSWLRGENNPATAAGVPGWVPNISGGWHHEAGLSLNGLFGLLRVDFARRLDEPGWAIGFGVARLF